MDVIILNRNLHHSNANGFSKFMWEFRSVILSGKCCSIFHYLKEFTDVTDSKWKENVNLNVLFVLEGMAGIISNSHLLLF